jgi:virulence factor
VNSGSARLRAAVVGLGDIARKAYLPALATRRDLDLHLCTRNAATLADVADAYRVEHRYDDLDNLIAAGVEAAFVHVATAAHVEVVDKLLRAGVHVFVDKPLADNLDDSRRLVELARGNRRSLMVGFNRRHAPVYQQLAAPKPSLVLLQKNRVNLAAAPRRVILDDFIHVLDTLRFLVPEAEIADVRGTVRDGQLELVTVELVAPGVTAIGSMNRVGGHTQEILDVQAPGVRRVVHDMVTTEEFRDDRHFVVRRGDWTTVQRQRGFDAMCERFISAVRSDEVLDADDALRTHEFCERVVEQLETC